MPACRVRSPASGDWRRSGPQHVIGHARRGDAGEAVDLRAAKRRRIVDGRATPSPKLADPVGQDGDAALAPGPIAGRQIVQHLAEAVARRAPRPASLASNRRERDTPPPSKPAFAASAKRSRNGASVKSMVRLAANLGIGCPPCDRLSVEQRHDRQSAHPRSRSASSSNSTTASMSVPMAMLVTRSRMNLDDAPAPGVPPSGPCACETPPELVRARCTRIALQPRPSATATWSTP